jgi:hypothetical protein
MIPYETRYVDFKQGIIDEVLPRSQYTSPPYICLYNILFDDFTKAVEVHEYKIKKQSNNSSLIPVQYDNTTINNLSKLFDTQTINDLLLLNNLNQITKKNKLIPINQTINQTTNNLLEYQDLNEDKKLQNEVIIFYHSKTIKWLDENEEFKKLKKHLKFIKSKNGINYIKTVIKLYIKKHNAKWYELRDDMNYDNVKEYIRKNLLTV